MHLVVVVVTLGEMALGHMVMDLGLVVVDPTMLAQTKIIRVV
jgi:hypothetical protein